MNKLEQEANNWMKERKMMSSITATEYQIRAAETAIFPKEKALEYITLGLTGEAGEIANKVKKLIRDGADIEGYNDKRESDRCRVRRCPMVLRYACKGSGHESW